VLVPNTGGGDEPSAMKASDGDVALWGSALQYGTMTVALAAFNSQTKVPGAFVHQGQAILARSAVLGRMPNRPRVTRCPCPARLGRFVAEEWMYGIAVDEFQAAQLIAFVLVAALLIGMEVGIRRVQRRR
jgi:hypothetical protein